MRYIGNKTKLLDFIGGVLRRRGIRGGGAVDPFCGTASVSRALKRRGFKVLAADVLEIGHVFGRAYVQAPGIPDFAPLAPVVGTDTATPEGVVAWLNRIQPHPAFIHAHFSPEGGDGRMYFTPVNAARIDAVRRTLGSWQRAGLLADDAFYLLVTALIEAADRVANTTGVYASYVKSWQPNALAPLHLRLPRPVPGEGSRAVRAEARELVRGLEPFELLYLDPPYNNRQYPAYYHIPEIIAMGWDPFPPVLRGKVGLLLHDGDKRSPFTSRRKGPEALEQLIATAPCKHIALSYNAEGVIPEHDIVRILKANGLRSTYFCYRRRYRRYRSDADSSTRRYRGDVVEERLYCVSR